MMPLLKSHIYFAPIAEGVFFSAGKEKFVLKCSGAYPVVAKLLGRLDGTFPLDQLEKEIPEKIMPLFQTLVKQLTQYGMLVDANLGGGSLPGEWNEAYQSTITYLKDVTRDHVAAFRYWRGLKISVGGSGYAFKSVIQALVRSGAGDLAIFPEGGQARCADAECLRALDEIPDDARIVSRPPVAEANSYFRRENSYLLYASDDLEAAAGGEVLSRMLAAENVQRIAGGVANGSGIVCPEFLMKGASIRDVLDRMPRSQSPSLQPSVSVQSVVGNIIAFEALKHAVGATRNQVWQSRLGRFFLVSEGLAVSDHPIAGLHALPPDAAGIDFPVEPDAADVRDHLRNTEPLFDPVTGLFSRVRVEGGRELPLPHECILVHAPRCLGGQSSAVTVWGVDADAVRINAVLESCRVYVTLADPNAPAECVVAAMGHSRWYDLALAKSIAALPEFRDAAAHLIDLESVRDSSSRLYIRLARLYSDTLPVVIVRHLAGMPAYSAEARLAQRFCTRVAASAEEAVREALGEICSHLQLAKPIDPEPASQAGPRTPVSLDDPALRARPMDQTIRIRQCKFVVDRMLCDVGVHVGWIEVQKI
jgi:hypothetical protein